MAIWNILRGGVSPISTRSQFSPVSLLRNNAPASSVPAGAPPPPAPAATARAHAWIDHVVEDRAEGEAEADVHRVLEVRTELAPPKQDVFVGDLSEGNEDLVLDPGDVAPDVEGGC